MSQNYRKERLDELLWQELNSIVMYELEDPVLVDVSVNRVDVSRDLQIARVYVSLLEEERDEREILRHLEKAKGFLRSQLALRVQMRRVPDLVFKMDLSRAYGERIDAILDSLPPPATGDLIDSPTHGDAS